MCDNNIIRAKQLFKVFTWRFYKCLSFLFSLFILISFTFLSQRKVSSISSIQESLILCFISNIVLDEFRMCFRVFLLFPPFSPGFFIWNVSWVSAVNELAMLFLFYPSISSVCFDLVSRRQLIFLSSLFLLHERLSFCHVLPFIPSSASIFKSQYQLLIPQGPV